jgi:hypothetical protein
MKELGKTNSEATNGAICVLLPIGMSRLRSMRFFMAASTAVLRSASLPRMATTMMPTKTLDMPAASAACPTDPTKISLQTAS